MGFSLQPSVSGRDSLVAVARVMSALSCLGLGNKPEEQLS